MPFYLYRKNGGQVLAASVQEAWTEDDYLSVFEDAQNLDLSTAYWCNGSQIREATAEEIAAFDGKVIEDQIAKDRLVAKDIADALANYRQALPRVLQALASLMLQEINTLRTALSLPTYTAQQFKTALKNQIDSE